MSLVLTDLEAKRLKAHLEELLKDDSVVVRREAAASLNILQAARPKGRNVFGG